MKLPKRYNYAEAYLTFKCGLGCSYCINRQDGIVERSEIPVRQWAEGLNRIDFGTLPLTLGGGEPTQYPGFYELLNRIKPETRIDLLTNLQFDIGEFIQQTSPERFSPRGLKVFSAYRSIRASYHPETMEPFDTIERASLLQDEGFNIGIFGLNHPGNVEANMEMAEMARQTNVYFFIKDFLGRHEGQVLGYYRYPRALDGKAKGSLCRTKELLIAPDGQIHRCHRDLYRGVNPIGVLGSPSLKIEDVFRPCKKYGLCNPCDVKLKTNRFLQMGNCQVEIVEK